MKIKKLEILPFGSDIPAGWYRVIDGFGELLPFFYSTYCWTFNSPKIKCDGISSVSDPVLKIDLDEKLSDYKIARYAL